MKRRLTMLGVFLLLGAAVNVAVAWGCQLRSPVTWRGETAIDQKDREWLDRNSVESKDQQLSSSGGFGHRCEWIDLKDRLGDAESFGRLCRIWNANGIHSRVVTMPAFAERNRAGWPMYAMYGERWFWPLHGFPFIESRPLSVDERISFVGSIAVPSSFSTKDFDDDGIPAFLGVTPIPVGFAVNTLSYAAVCWMLFAVPGLLCRRRRRRRGRCIHCGYDLRGHAPANSSEASNRMPGVRRAAFAPEGRWCVATGGAQRNPWTR